MLRDDRTRRQELLEKHIKTMALKPIQNGEFQEIVKDLETNIYIDGFEHCEPELFTLISEMFKKDAQYTLDYLSLNLIELRNHIEKEYEIKNKNDKYQYLAKQIDKLCDYVNLEIGRLNYYLINNNKINDLESKISDVNTSVVETENKLKAIDDTSDGVKEKVQNLQRDSITILGIFASIVLTFTGGMIFSSSVLENIGRASAYRIIIVTLIIGWVMVNSIISLIMYIGKITRFKDEDRLGIKDWIVRNVYWISVNAILVVLIFLTYNGWLHSTEKKLVDQSNLYQIEMHHKNTEELKGSNSSISSNNLNE